MTKEGGKTQEIVRSSAECKCIHIMKPIVFLQFNTKILSFPDTCSPTEKIIKFEYTTLVSYIL